jgi:Pyridoxamine 5'-phosphate oxidase
MRWRDFAPACPELAALVRARFEREQILLLGTLRPDGSPRISAVECDFADGDLMTGMIWRSAKALDLIRDDRVTIHSLVPDKAHESENQGDLKLYGRAVQVTDPAGKRHYEDALHARIGWRPPEPYHCFAFDIEHAGMVRFTGNNREVHSWHVGGELTVRVQPVPGPG